MFDDRVYELYALREQAREAGLAFEPADATPKERADLDRLIADLDAPATADAAPDLPASTGRYRFDAFLARGGMGEVYRGEDTVLHRPVALKVLRRRLGVSAATFRAEAELVARLAHPGIVPVHDVGTLADGRPFFAMKLVEGRTLEAALGQCDARSSELPRWLPWFEQVCQAVAYAHAQSPPLLHRDLKPQNVMVGAYGEVLVMDWGIARVTGGPAATESVPVTPIRPAGESTVDESRAGTPEETATGVAKGTVAYMAPEQARGERGRIGPAADVFGLGGLLCRMLTGKPTFVGDDGWTRALAGDVSEAHARLDASGADTALVAVAKRCLSSDAADRYRDAGEAASAMQAYLASVQEKLKQAEVERARIEAKAEGERRRRRVMAALAASLLALVAVGGFSAWYSQRQSTRRAQAESAKLLQEEASRLEERLQAERTRLAADAAFARLPELYRRAFWHDADDALARVEGMMGEGGDLELRGRLAAARRETAFLKALDDVAMRTDLIAGKRNDVRKKHLAYRKAFADFGLDVATDEPESVAARIVALGCKTQVVHYLDLWMMEALDDVQSRLVKITSRVTCQSWRLRLVPLPDGEALERLYASVPRDDLSPGMYLFFASRLRELDRPTEHVTNEALRHHPTDFWVYFFLGTRLSASLESNAAASRAAIAVRPESALSHHNLGVSLREHDPEESKWAFRRALELDPNLFNSRSALSSLHEDVDAPTALEEMRLALVLDDRDVLMRLRRSLLLATQKKPEAITEATRAMQIESAKKEPLDLAECHYTLGFAHLRTGSPQLAVTELKRSLSLSPDHARAHHQLGKALTDLGDSAGALASFERAARLAANDEGFVNDYALALMAANREPEAQVQFRRLASLMPHSPLPRHNIGLLLKDSDPLQASREATEAIWLYAQSPDRFPDVPIAMTYALRASALEKSGDLRGAIRDYESALLYDPGFSTAYALLGTIYEKAEDWPRLVGLCEREIAQDDRNPKSHRALAYTLQRMGKADAAARAYRRASELDPKDGFPNNEIAKILLAAGDPVAAEREFQEAVRRGPDDAGFQRAYGIFLSNARRHPEATAVFERVTALAPKDPLGWDSLGLSRAWQSDVPGALAAWGEAIRLDPMHVRRLLPFAGIRAAVGDVIGSARIFRLALDRDPRFSRAHHHRGVGLFLDDRFEDAAAAHRKASLLDPRDPEPIVSLGIAQASLGDHSAAVTEFQRALAMAPYHVECRLHLAASLRSLQRFPEAFAAYREGLRLDPSHAVGHHEYGLALLRSGDPAKAADSFRESIRLDGEDAFPHHNLAVSLEVLGDYEAAAKACARAGQLAPKLRGHAVLSARLKAIRDKLSRVDSIATGLDPLDSAVDYWNLATVCGRPFQMRYATATVLAARAFALDATLADDFWEGRRHNAACWAILALSGGHPDAAALGVDEQSYLRGKAREWLRGNLDFLNRLALLPAMQPIAADLARQQAEDPDLALSRDPDALATLPDEERAAWTKLWQDNARLRRR